MICPGCGATRFPTARRCYNCGDMHEPEPKKPGPPPMPTGLDSKVLALLQETAPDQRIMAWQFNKSHGIEGSELRQAVSRLRRLERPVGSGRTGYFLARRADELDETLHDLKSRIAKLEEVVAGVEGAQAALRLAEKRQNGEAA